MVLFSSSMYLPVTFIRTGHKGLHSHYFLTILWFITRWL
jgi:hypothetical protein